MKVCWITLCYNEMDILPFVSGYWERIADKVVVFDNGSIDGSIEYLKSLPYVELRHFDSDGHNDVIHKQVKEQAYLEYKDQYDIIIISDMDEVFYFNDFKAVSEGFVNGGYNVLITPIFSLCEDSKPPYIEGKLLHEQCTKFYKQRMNHTTGFEDVSKFSIFNCHTVDKVHMSVGQHYVKTMPSMSIMYSNDGFNLHVDKGFGIAHKYRIRQRMNERLSDTNRKFGMAIEYANNFETLKQEYINNQAKSFNINDHFSNHHKPEQ